MLLEPLRALLQTLYTLLESNDEKALFLVLLVEEAGVPLPAPGDLVIMFAGYRAAAGEMGIVEAALAVTLGVQLGSTFLYFLSRKMGHSLLRRYGKYMHLNADRLDMIEAWLQRRGPVMVFVGRLTPGLRIPTSIAAGCFRIPFPQFMLFTSLAAATWSLFWIALGYFFGGRLLPMMQNLHGPLTVAGGAAVVAVALIALAMSLWLRRTGRSIRPLLAWRPRFGPKRPA